MIRIISGEFKNRRIETPEGTDRARPLPEKVRGAILNMLRGHLEGFTIIDAFAGTGSFGLEAVSRGASRVIFIEKDRDMLRLLRGNIAALGVGDRCEVFEGDVLGTGALARCPRPSHVVFFDPPYPMMEDPAQRARAEGQFARFVELLDLEGFGIIRTPWPFIEHIEVGPERTDRREVSLSLPSLLGPETHAYGSTAVHWYARRPETQ